MTEHIPLPNVVTHLPRGDFEADLTEPMGALHLYAKGVAVKEGLVRAGHYGIPDGATVIDLGNAIDIIPLARRLKALDATQADRMITVYDVKEPEFKRIAAQSEEDSSCMYGVSFLVFERSTYRFLEFFCGTKTTRAEASGIYPFLPLTAADIDRRATYYGHDVSKLTPHGPLPLTLKSRQIKTKRSYSWYVPVILECSMPFTGLPSPKRMATEIRAFLACKGDEPFTADQQPSNGASAG